ncbi:uncharacterized protein LOC121693769 isoform X2 [Alosa sapidissima]|uniref:uncharacterized protein LOC121693769 isoform X2 n=1 Tax=Alosa sapidissima TaxID=34773 RepID=UPI001C0878AB|nr:uncharacterized protein LOC121693769 isoform X2 [Alosa sapidissima]
MGNTVSCCFRPNPRDRREDQEEGQRLHEDIQTQQTSVKTLEGGSVGATRADSSDSPLLTNDEGTGQSKPGLPLEISQQEKPTESAVVTNVRVDAASAVDKSVLLYQQEVAAAGLVSEVLTKATEIVAVSMEKPKSLDPVTIPAVKLENRLVQNPSAEEVVYEAPKGVSLEIDAQLDICGHQVLLEKPTASAVVTNVRVDAASAVDKSVLLYQQEVAAAGLVSEVLTKATEIVAVSMEKPKSLDPVTIPAVKLENRLVQNPSAEEVVYEAPKGVSLEIDAQLDICGHQVLLEKPTASAVVTNVRVDAASAVDKSVLLYQQEVAAAGLVSEVLTKATEIVAVSMEKPKSLDPVTIPAVKLENRLVQNPSAEEVVYEAPKGVSLEIDAQLDICGHQVLFYPSAVGDYKQDVPLHSSEGERLLTPAMLGTGFPLNDAKLAETVLQHRSDRDHLFSMERQQPESGLELYSAPGDASARGSAAASAPQDVVFGLSAEFSLGDRLRDGWLDERPGSTGSWSPLSVGSEAWFTCEEDLYYSEEEIENVSERQGLMDITEQGRCGFGPPVAISIYSERELKGQSTKSIIIRKGYAVLSQSFGFLRRVRGDNYCALRASLYQALMRSTKLPGWLKQKSILLIPEELESHYGLIKGWLFPDTCKYTTGIGNAVDLMKHYLGLLQKWWRAAAVFPGLECRRSVCEQLFQGGEDEFGVMEALKLLMLAHAVDLHAAVQRGDTVPIFCWLLFARSSSSCPRSYLANHLSQVGFSRGMEQVDMFLLGCAMRHTIKVYRLHMAETEEFISYYPDDSIQDGPCVCLITEDDRHYNMAFGNPACPEQDLSVEPD